MINNILLVTGNYHDASLCPNCFSDTMLQDFVRHFFVLLPRGTSPTKSGIREFFRRIHLPPAGYQVGNTMVGSLEISQSVSFLFTILQP